MCSSIKPFHAQVFHFKINIANLGECLLVKGQIQPNLTHAYDYNQHQLLMAWLLYSPSKTLAENEQNH